MALDVECVATAARQPLTHCRIIIMIIIVIIIIMIMIMIWYALRRTE